MLYKPKQKISEFTQVDHPDCSEIRDLLLIYSTYYCNRHSRIYKVLNHDKLIVIHTKIISFLSTYICIGFFFKYMSTILLQYIAIVLSTFFYNRYCHIFLEIAIIINFRGPATIYCPLQYIFDGLWLLVMSWCWGDVFLLVGYLLI